MADRSGYIGRAPSDSSITVARQTNQPTGVTTTFVFNSGYDVGYLDVYVNGSKLINVVGDGSELTGVSGFATALSSDQTSPLNVFFKTPQQVNIGAGTSVTVESDATSGNIAFIRESIVHVATGATFHVKTSTTLVTNVLSVF